MLIPIGVNAMSFRFIENGHHVSGATDYDNILCKTFHCISATGTIDKNSSTKLQKLLNSKWLLESKLKAVVVFDSPGGILSESLKVGRLIRSKGHHTSVGRFVWAGPDKVTFTSGRCFSACAYAFLGGASRGLSGGSALGVHQFFSKDDFVNPLAKTRMKLERFVDQYVMSKLGRYVEDMGVSARFLEAASKTFPTKMHVLTKQELEAWNIVITTSEAQEEWFLKPKGNGLIAHTKLTTKRRGTIVKDIEFSLDIFCHKQDAILILSIKHGDLGNIIETGTSASDLNVGIALLYHLPPDQDAFSNPQLIHSKKWEKRGETSYLEIRSPLSLFDTLQEIKHLGLSVSWVDFGDLAIFNLDGSKKILSIARKNCI